MTKHPHDELHAIRDEVRQRAAAHGGVFRRSDLMAWGVFADLVVPMQRRKWWVRLHHGVYADARDLTDADARARHLLQCAAGIRALREPAYAFGVTAALVHNSPLPPCINDTVSLVRPTGRDGRALRRRISAPQHLTGVVVRTQRLDQAELVEVGGIPTVSRQLAAVSAAAECSPDWAVAVLDAAAWQQPSAIPAMVRLAEGLQHLAGIGLVRASLPLVRAGAQSPFESISRVRLVNCGLPEPELQVPFHDRRGLIGYADMYFRELGVIGEADGMLKYRTGADLIAEKSREDRLRAHAPVVRWDWTEIWDDPMSIAQRILEAARYRRAS